MLKAVAQRVSRKGGPSVWLAVAALGLAIGASALVALPCAYAEESEATQVGSPGEDASDAPPVVTRSCRSLWEHSRPAVVFFAGPPLALTSAGVLAALIGRRKVVLVLGVTMAVIAHGLTLLSFSFFPLFFAPSAGLLCVAGIRRRAAGASP